MHLNVNSLQNKFEEVSSLMKEFKAQVVYLTETKIDASYSNSQFMVEGYNIYRNDRTKGGGGILAYFSSSIPSKKLKLPRKYKTIEPLVIQSKFGCHEVIVVGLYRPPKAVGEAYYVRLEEELNEIRHWSSLEKQFIIITGDLNLNRLKPESREGKILNDLEEVHGLECLVKKPTRITNNSETLLDVIITNKPELFVECDVYDPQISDHAMVYGVMSMKAVHYPYKIMSFRNYKNINEKQLKEDLDSAPWHIADMLETVDEKYDCWYALLNSVLDEHAPIKKMKVRSKDVPYMTARKKNMS